MPLTPEEAGENDRAISMLRKRLERVRERMQQARGDADLSGVFLALDAALSIEEYDLIRNSLPKLSGEKLAELRAERDALVKAIDALRARA